MPSELTEKQIAGLRQSLKKRYYELREEVRQELLKTDDDILLILWVVSTTWKNNPLLIC